MSPLLESYTEDQVKEYVFYNLDNIFLKFEVRVRFLPVFCDYIGHCCVITLVAVVPTTAAAAVVIVKYISPILSQEFDLLQ